MDRSLAGRSVLHTRYGGQREVCRVVSVFLRIYCISKVLCVIISCAANQKNSLITPSSISNFVKRSLQIEPDELVRLDQVWAFKSFFSSSYVVLTLIQDCGRISLRHQRHGHVRAHHGSLRRERHSYQGDRDH